MVWLRPAGAFPRIWARFQILDESSDTLTEYVVQDMPENRFDDAVQFMLKFFSPDEPLHSVAGVDILTDPISCEELKKFWTSILQHRVSLVCFKTGCQEIVGMNLLHVKCVEDAIESHVKVCGERWQILTDIFAYIPTLFNPFEKYKVDKYLSAVGLCVHPDYRRRGIACEILKSRLPLCRAFDIKLTTTIFTAIGSQVAASRVGFQEDHVFEYSNLTKINQAYIFPEIKTKTFITMSMKIQ